MLDVLVKNGVVKLAEPDSWTQADVDAAADYFEDCSFFVPYAMMCVALGCDDTLKIHALKPIELCRLLNSTPLGTVVTEQRIRTLRTRAGLRIGKGTVDFIRFLAWLIGERGRVRRSRPEDREPPPPLATFEDAEGCAAVAVSNLQPEVSKGNTSTPTTSSKNLKILKVLTPRHERAIAALLTERTHRAAAEKIGVTPATLCRWLQQPLFRSAYLDTRRELVDAAVGRMQAAAGQAVQTLVTASVQAKRDSDRIRASLALLDHAVDGLTEADRRGESKVGGAAYEGDATPITSSEVVKSLAARLRALEASQGDGREKTRLTATLAGPLLQALELQEFEERLDALERVLNSRPEPKEERP
jgi:hypothetical protein